MDQVVEICFKYQHDYYICLLTVAHRSNTDFFHIELMDAETIKIFDTADISYSGITGYKTLSAFKSDSTRPLLLHLTNLVLSARRLTNIQNVSNLLAIGNSNYLKN